MATITTWNDGDNGSTVQDLVNANFVAINAAIVEADSTTILTNKTIDAANNTISNLDTTHFVATAKTGSDLDFVTGTAGGTGELLQWDANGDAITSGLTLNTDGTMVGASNTTVPSSLSMKTYVDSQVPTRSFQGSWNGYSSGTTITQNGNVGGIILNGTNDFVYYHAMAPGDLTTVTAATVSFFQVTGTASNPQVTVNVSYFNPSSSEAATTHSSSAVYSLPTSFTSLASTQIDLSAQFATLSSGDAVVVKITLTSGSGTLQISPMPFIVSYT